ncbi:ngg1 interacting factor [Grosmannia clavigera kw1407]|uniref:Ngg1 interacting factor n=1 Tax=Grosmannia clavigera (strain kw1407 / UAMH 11150) TaxID=655863 RepID=F0XND6_GROCL|nr:ngg1 interacting factor [Grosmannia clavigera kw1407]EFX00911.1 ngg1 interacting factor [Grosmannia clavigera kw1407]
MEHPRNTFTAGVVNAMQRLYPLEYADSAWDNVGLLLGNLEETEPFRNRVLLTTDLTASVVDEAIQYDVSVIVAYHPIIFRGLKAITPADTQQASLLRLAQKNIAVYCPHTALDAAKGGLNDWLADKVEEAAAEAVGTAAHVLDGSRRTTLKPVRGPESVVGYGRQVDLPVAVDAFALVRSFAQRLGGMRHVLIAPPADYRDGLDVAEHLLVRSVAVCAGSGSDVLKAATSAKMLLTGEMSHHDVLAAVSRNRWVVCVLHSNSERLFLAETLQAQLQHRLAAGHDDAKVLVSQNDHDPFLFWDVSEPPPSGQKPLPAACAI